MQGTWENGSFVLASTKDDKIARLETTISRLREYAGHKQTCGALQWNYITSEFAPCDCGYDELMKEMEETK